MDPSPGSRSLYHYEPFNESWIRQLLSGKLYFSNPHNFNDPWDCQPCFDSTAAYDSERRERHVEYYIRITRQYSPDLDEAEIQRRAQMYRDNPDFLKERIDDFTAKFPTGIQAGWRMYCVSTKPDSELMWAHYAAQHTGICLEFSCLEHPFCHALKVEYLVDYPKFEMADTDIGLRILLTKSKAWEYEDEHRLIAQDESVAFSQSQPFITRNNLFEIPDGCLTSIIVGCRAPASTLETIENLLQGRPIDMKVAKKSQNQYRLFVA